MHEGGRRNARAVVPRTRDASFDIREEFGSRAARATRPQEPSVEESSETRDVEQPTGDAAGPSENGDGCRARRTSR